MGMASDMHVKFYVQYNSKSCGCCTSIRPTIGDFVQVEDFATWYISSLIKTFYLSRSYEIDQIEKVLRTQCQKSKHKQGNERDIASNK